MEVTTSVEACICVPVEVQTAGTDADARIESVCWCQWGAERKTCHEPIVGDGWPAFKLTAKGRCCPNAYLATPLENTELSPDLPGAAREEPLVPRMPGMDRMGAASVSLVALVFGVPPTGQGPRQQWSEDRGEGNLPARAAIYRLAPPIANPSQSLPWGCWLWWPRDERAAWLVFLGAGQAGVCSHSPSSVATLMGRMS